MKHKGYNLKDFPKGHYYVKHKGYIPKDIFCYEPLSQISMQWIPQREVENKMLQRSNQDLKSSLKTTPLT